jgi:ubiquinone/menaquinone biosynthesis C-methylase UbiE
MNLEWDYTNRAATYDARVDYSAAALDRLVQEMGCLPRLGPVADIGAGTGKLTVPLLDRGFTVLAIEPNDAMRAVGIRNTATRSVTWSNATMHVTGLDRNSVAYAFFGSSFSVAEQQATLRETSRILKPNGAIAFMWNHRDLTDPLQEKIENIFKREVPAFSYGKRREDPIVDINKSKLFGPVSLIEDRFIATVSAKSWLSAWSSHATVVRQVGETKMNEIVAEIHELIGDTESLSVPYYTRIWWARCTVEKHGVSD